MISKEKSIIENERKKYDYLHTLSGFDTNQDGYGRQLALLLSSNMKFFDMLRNDLLKDAILEIGVGSGEMTRWLCHEYKDTISIDISDYAINSLQKLLNISNEKIVACSAHALSFNNERFNTVMHLDGMEHIPAEIELECLSEAVRVCKRGGRIYYANACCDAWWDHKLFSAGFDPAHINIKSFESWNAFYKQHSKRLEYNICHYETLGETFYTVLEKK